MRRAWTDGKDFDKDEVSMPGNVKGRLRENVKWDLAHEPGPRASFPDPSPVPPLPDPSPALSGHAAEV